MLAAPAPSPASPSAGPSVGPSAGYARREPEKTVLHLVVREHLETFLATVREERGKDLPRYVEQELRRYLECGILCHGFLRARCRKCRREIVVAHSCKCRGACPSCAARRMCGSAAHLVDQVLPADVPVRQWVLTAPYGVRRVLALRPDALTACARFFVEELARWQKRVGSAGGETGAITFVQRFDGALGCFVHFHVAVPDGVFTRAEGDGRVTFHRGPAPSRADIESVAARVEKRMTRWLRRRGLVDDRAAEERSNEAPELSPLEACMQMSLFGSTFMHLATDGTPVPLVHERSRPAPKGPWVGEASGYNVHAGATVRAGDREGLERLLRYCARPAFSLERLSLLPDGRVAYLLRKPRRNGATHLVMTPLQFLARLSALIPPPRYPLSRLSGVFAPRSSWRSAVVPSPEGPCQGTLPAKPSGAKAKAKSGGASPLASDPERGRASEYAAPDGPRTSLGDGVVRPVGARLPWATLLKRVYLEDVLACPCGGRREIIAHIVERDVVVEILEHLELPTEAPKIARARSPGAGAA